LPAAIFDSLYFTQMQLGFKVKG